jgi:hypothetical protein
MKYGKNVVIIALLSSFFSCISTKEKSKITEKETEVKTETEKSRYSYLKKQPKTKNKFCSKFRQFIIEPVPGEQPGHRVFFAELKNGKIEIVYIQPKTTETREERTKDKETKKKRKR